MKRITLLILVFCFTQSINGQRIKGDWTIGFGVNAVNSNGKRSPLNSPGDWAFNTPFAFSAEYALSEIFALEQSFSFNKFTDSNVIDNGMLLESISFFSTNTKFKWYFDDYIFYRNSSWFDFSVNGGMGVFSMEGEVKATVDFGFDGFVWFDENWGAALKSLAKVTFNDDTIYVSNHWQFFLEVVYKID